MTEIQRQGKLLMQTRNAFLAQHHLQAGKLGQSDAALEKHQKRLKSTESRAKDKASAPSTRPPSTATLTAALDALLPLDYDAEARRIVASYGPQDNVATGPPQSERASP